MSGGYDRLGAGGSFLSQWNWGFTLAWELDFWGRFRRAVQAADAQLDASIAGYDDVLVTLLADVANNYVTIRVRQEQIRLLDENIAIQQFVLTVGEERLRAGTITSVDVDQVRSNLLQNQAQREQLYVNLRQTSDRFLDSARPPRNLVEEASAGSIPCGRQPAGPSEFPRFLLRRPDVRRWNAGCRSSRTDRHSALADLYPAIAIHGSLGYRQLQNLSHLFTSDAFTGSVGPSFRWDLLNYGRPAKTTSISRTRPSARALPLSRHGMGGRCRRGRRRARLFPSRAGAGPDCMTKAAAAACPPDVQFRANFCTAGSTITSTP